jgi:hypothetical protein
VYSVLRISVRVSICIHTTPHVGMFQCAQELGCCSMPLPVRAPTYFEYGYCVRIPACSTEYVDIA